MPRLEEVEHYLRGIVMLLRGNPEGLRWLDISMRGFWRSWWAVLFALPPVLLNWVAFRIVYLDQLPAGARLPNYFYLKLLLVEASAWIVPVVAIVLLAKVLRLQEWVIIALLVASNWLSVPIQWLYSIENLVQFLFPTAYDVAGIFFLAFLTLSLIAHYRIFAVISAPDRLSPFAIVLVLFFVSFYTQYHVMLLTGLWSPS
ncbi:MAG: hypothetical protein RLZZ444_463 [Pseudomonadota bacterium]